ncbi:MAG: RagB/SusD family nutrient uptake outer membrane protein [Bacteroidales bacterium]|nr:RagB/SusD family nutrient uptake outer membrane protein [Bacteroidales bacterium]
MKKLIYIAIAMLAFSSCKKEWLDVAPSNAVPAEKSIETLGDAQVALNGVYNTLQSSDYYGADLITYGDVRGEDMRTYKMGKRTFDAYAFTHSTDATIGGLWKEPYVVISLVNNILANIDALEVEPSEQAIAKDVKGQAYALRALALFDLTRLHGYSYKKDNGVSFGVPIITSYLQPDAQPKRNTVAECYEQVIRDLNSADELLNENVANGFINKWAAKSLLSRVYLYMGEDELALTAAESVINAGKYNLISKDKYVESWAAAFTSESVFSIVNTGEDNADREALGYLYDPEGYGAITLTDKYIAMISQDASDVRAQLLTHDARTGETVAEQRLGLLLKYPGIDHADSRVNNVPVIRLAEVYLIAAEAAVSVNNAKAVDYLNTIHEARTGNIDVFASVTLQDVMLERRKELVGEGHRFFDGIRNGETIDRTGEDQFFTDEYTFINWDVEKSILPIPRRELDVNMNIQQNPGYQK